MHLHCICMEMLKFANVRKTRKSHSLFYNKMPELLSVLVDTAYMGIGDWWNYAV